MGCFVQGGKNGMGCFVWGDKNYMVCFVQGGKSMRDVLSRMSKNGMGCFVAGCFVLHSIETHPFLAYLISLLRSLYTNDSKISDRQ